MARFIEGASHFVTELGVPLGLARAFIAVVVVSFALTTLDSATRLLRYNVEEIAQSMGLRRGLDRHLSTLVAVLAIGFFAFFYPILSAWPLAGEMSFLDWAWLEGWR